MRRGLILGFAGWLAAFAVFRLFGGAMLGTPVAIVVTMLLGGPAAAAVALLLGGLFCTPGKVARFAAGLAVPGLLLDAATLLAFDRLLPNMASELAAPYGTVMLWAYGLVLGALLLFGDRVVRDHDR